MHLGPRERRFHSEGSIRVGKLKGIAKLEAFRAGKKMARSASIQAKCAECMNEYVDGARDCHIKTCPLYPFMPYNGKSGEDLTALAEQEGLGEETDEPEPMETGEVEI